MDRPLKITVAVTAVAVLAVSVLMCIFAAPYITLATADKTGAPFESKYVMDEEWLHVQNIPFDEYLHKEEVKEGEKLYDIRSYGADVSADYATNRKAVNSAIEAASAAGGGVVYVSGGEYVCANIRMLSDVTLRIAADSALVNVTYEEDKESNGDFHADEENNTIQRNALIYAENARNIRIEGPGKIIGQGATYCYDQEDPSPFFPLNVFNLKVYVSEHRKRIMMGKEHEMTRDFVMAVNYCENVEICNLEIKDSGSWTCRMEGNENLLFRDVVINNNVRVANTDGIDIMGGKNTVIRHCFIATGDDAICLKTDPGNQPVEGVLVEDCEIMSLANCFKTGTSTYNDIKDVTVRDCYFFMPGIAGGYAGIAIEATDGGKVSDITVENITMDHITSPLLVWLGYREEGSELENVTIRGITATGCDIACAVTGYKKGSGRKKVVNVTLEDFDVTYREAQEDLNIYMGDSVYSGSMNMGGYPEITRVSHMYIINHDISPYYDLPAYGLYAAYTENLQINNFNVRPRECNTREKIIIRN